MHHVSTTKLLLFAVSKDEWDTKEALESPYYFYMCKVTFTIYSLQIVSRFL